MMVWIDLEMTGLDPTEHVICEIASIVTDDELNVVATGPELVIKTSEEAIGKMDAWCVEHHGKSGLTERMRASTISMREAEQSTMKFLHHHLKPGTAPLCGNSVWQDRRFLEAQMPEIEAFLHYRIVDVSSIKELVKRWYSKSALPPAKNNTHRAMDDILESIEELRYYRRSLFVPPETLNGET